MSKPIKPGPGQESVWDYPRPPRLEDSKAHIVVNAVGVKVAETRRAKRVLETSHPPVYYIPPQDIDSQYLLPSRRRSWCEWKGEARYYHLVIAGATIEDAAWYYPSPVPRFADLQSYVAFYPSKMDGCFVDGEKVQAQEGDFYGGWITSSIVGPFKGASGTFGW